MTKEYYLKQNSNLKIQIQQIAYDLELLQNEYIAANCLLKRGQRVRYITTEYFHDCEPIRKSNDANFTGKCEVNASGEIEYILCDVFGCGVCKLTANNFEVYND